MIILLYIGVLLVGGFIGARSLSKPGLLKGSDALLSGALLLLIYLMGVKIGLDDLVLSSFRTIGYQALVLALFSILFSTLGVKLVAGYVLRDKEGDQWPK